MTNKFTTQFLLRLPEDLNAKITTAAVATTQSKTDFIVEALTQYTNSLNVEGKLENPQDFITTARLNYASSLNATISNSLLASNLHSPTVISSLKSWQESSTNTSKYISTISDLGGETKTNEP